MLPSIPRLIEFWLLVEKVVWCIFIFACKKAEKYGEKAVFSTIQANTTKIRTLLMDTKKEVICMLISF